MKNPFKVQSSRFKVQSSRFKAQPGTCNLESGTRNPEHAAVAWALGVVLALMSAVALAQALNDPMRPPTAYTAPESGGSDAGGPVLQSVMISPTLKAAIINGEMVKLGGKFGDAKLVKISESEVVLKSGEETQILKMYPGIDKHANVKTVPKRASSRKRAARQKPAVTGPEGKR
jgi:MSHA biogenesis protein MshK